MPIVGAASRSAASSSTLVLPLTAPSLFLWLFLSIFFSQEHTLHGHGETPHTHTRIHQREDSRCFAKRVCSLVNTSATSCHLCPHGLFF